MENRTDLGSVVERVKAIDAWLDAVPDELLMSMPAEMADAIEDARALLLGRHVVADLDLTGGTPVRAAEQLGDAAPVERRFPLGIGQPGHGLPGRPGAWIRDWNQAGGPSPR